MIKDQKVGLFCLLIAYHHYIQYMDTLPASTNAMLVNKRVKCFIQV